MQIPRNQEFHDCTTPRIVRGGFSNLWDSNACLTVEDDAPNRTVISVSGVLTDLAGDRDLPYALRYLFEEGRMQIEISAPQDSEFLFYAVSDAEKPIAAESQAFQFLRNGVAFTLRTDGILSHTEPRLFTPCGGFLSFPLRIQNATKIEILLL